MDAKDAEIRSASRQEQGHQRRYIFSLHLSVILFFPKNSSHFVTLSQESELDNGQKYLGKRKHV